MKWAVTVKLASGVHVQAEVFALSKESAELRATTKVETERGRVSHVTACRQISPSKEPR